MFKTNKLAVAALSTIAAAGVALGTAAPANAAGPTPRNGNCETGEFCYYYEPGQKGSTSDFTESVPFYGTDNDTCYAFKGAGKGQTKCIKDDAASAWNRTDKDVTVYFNSYYGGKTQVIKPGQKVELDAGLKNNNASHRIGAEKKPTPTSPQPHEANVNPYPSQDGENGGYTPRAKWLKGEIEAKFGLECSTYATSDPESEHSTGNALDCMGPVEKRRELAAWLAEPTAASKMKVWYVIHEQKIWFIERNNQQWKQMEDRGSATQNHMDHVHISMQHPTTAAHPGYEQG